MAAAAPAPISTMSVLRIVISTREMFDNVMLALADGIWADAKHIGSHSLLDTAGALATNDMEMIRMAFDSGETAVLMGKDMDIIENNTEFKILVVDSRTKPAKPLGVISSDNINY